VRSEVQTMVRLKIEVFWNKTPCLWTSWPWLWGHYELSKHR